MKKLFLSYSWDDDNHHQWIKKLADDLESDENFHVFWDGYDLDSLSDKNFYMENSVKTSDFILIVATENYKRKADSREGGVGIETYLSTANHWEKMIGSEKKTNIIVLLKDKESTPTYLNGHFYIDFTDENQYIMSVSKLKNVLLDTSRHNRPEKQRNSPPKKTYELTKASAIIGIGAKNRNQVISLDNGTDFSAGKKIKFELWELKYPGGNTTHVLALHNNINISQTLDRAASIITSEKIKITNLQLLRPREKRKGGISFTDVLLEKGNEKSISISISELTYDEYVWEYCIGSDFKSVVPPDAIEFYTNQELQDKNGKIHESAIKRLEHDLSESSEYSSHLIIGSGGIGKTSLCLSLVNRLIKNNSDKFLTILIRSEDIRKHIEKNNSPNIQIKGIYDIYELQAKYLNHVHIFDKNTFELSILSGNIIIVIDGLDELSSIFGECFSLMDFLKSISKLHDELGASRIVLTTRENSVISDNLIEELNINKYSLLGFKIENCRKYLNTRFKEHDDTASITTKILSQIEKCSLTGADRVIPFFIDVISNIYEDNIGRTNNNNNDFSLNEEPTPYPSLNEINDHIIISIFDREKVRHKFSISHIEMIDLFKTINIELSETWSVGDVRDLVTIFYDTQTNELLDCIFKNPLLIKKDEKIFYKYDFLHSYFNSLSIFECILDPVDMEQSITLLSKSSKDTPEFKDLIKFLRAREENSIELLKSILTASKNKATTQDKMDKLSKERAILAIENIILIVNNIKSIKKQDFTNDIVSLFEGSDTKKIHGIYLNGDLPPLDFSGLQITNSRFKNYTHFLKSNFNGAKFINTQFINCHNDSYKNSSLLQASIDRNTCDVGDLDYSFNMLSDAKETSKEVLIEELDKFLSSFYRGSSFRDNNKVHIRFSKHVTGLKSANFHKLISSGYLKVKVEKEVDTFYEITDYFKPSVRRFLNDGYKDSTMKKFISQLD